LKTYRQEILLFLSVWLVYGLTINSRNLEAFTLQQMGVEAIVERGTFYVEGSRSPQLQPLGDVFVYEGHKYAAKQPGQFMTGALVYFVLHALGFSYTENYLTTSALVTFFTASLMTALSSVVVFRLARALVKEKSQPLWPLSIALLYGWGTLAFPYAGIAHHDAIASGFVVTAFYFVFRLARDSSGGRRAIWLALGAGFFLGLTVTTSMLVFWPALAVALYLLSLRRFSLLHYFLLGGAVGLLPLLFYDAVNFGNPLLLPNVAGNYSDTFFHLDFNNFIDKLAFYLKWTTLYAPIFMLGLVGLFLLPAAFRRERLAAAASLLVLCAYIFNIDTVGTCQYGPRYLLPVMAFGCIGLSGFSHLKPGGARTGSIILMGCLGLLSVVINAVGAIHGTMYCDLGLHAFWPHVASLRRGEWGEFPLLAWLFIPTLFCLYALVRRSLGREGEPKAQRATGRRSKSSG
jgi:hypothetical protein